MVYLHAMRDAWAKFVPADTMRDITSARPLSWRPLLWRPLSPRVIVLP